MEIILIWHGTIFYFWIIGRGISENMQKSGLFLQGAFSSKPVTDIETNFYGILLEKVRDS